MNFRDNMKKLYFILIAATCLPLNVVAQQNAKNSGYFIESYNYRHNLNPAFASTRSYFSIISGNINFGVQSNMAASTFLYPYNGQLTTFMSSSVSSDEFLSKLNRNNRLSVNAYVPALTVGSWGRNGGFTTFDLGVKVNAMANIPYALFDFMKNPGSSRYYNISNLGVNAKAYLEMAIGHSHKISDRLDIGVKVKLLAGIVNADAKFRNLDLTMSEDQWKVNADGQLRISAPMLDIKTKGQTGSANDPSQNDLIDFNTIIPSFSNMNVSEIISSAFSGLGYGAALDLGAAYYFDSGLLEGLNLSAAVLDLGVMSWGNTVNAVTDVEPWVFDGFEELSFDSESENSLSNQIDGIFGNFEDMLRLKLAEGSKRKTEMLACTVNLGAEYEMPFYRKMSVGFLSTTMISGRYTHSEGRFSLNLEPVKWFGFSTSYGISPFGSRVGAMLNFNFPGIGLFIAADNIPLQYSAPLRGAGIGVPYNTGNVDLGFGMNFNLSKVKHLGDRKERRSRK